MWCLYAQCKHSIRFNTRSQLGRKMHARDKMRTRRKTSFSISLPSSKLTISSISIYKHYAIDIADPSTMQDACHTWTSLSVESLWLSGGASERGIRTSAVRFLMRTQNLFFVPRSWQDEINLSPFLYRAQNLLSFLFYLQGIHDSTIIFSF